MLWGKSFWKMKHHSFAGNGRRQCIHSGLWQTATLNWNLNNLRNGFAWWSCLYFDPSLTSNLLYCKHNYMIKWPLICCVQLVDRSGFINVSRETKILLKVKHQFCDTWHFNYAKCKRKVNNVILLIKYYLIHSWESSDVALIKKKNLTTSANLVFVMSGLQNHPVFTLTQSHWPALGCSEPHVSDGLNYGCQTQKHSVKLRCHQNFGPLFMKLNSFASAWK